MYKVKLCYITNYNYLFICLEYLKILNRILINNHNHNHRFSSGK